MWNELAQTLPFELKTIASVAITIVVGTLLYLLARRGLSQLAKNGAVAEPLVRLLRIILRWIFVTLMLLLVLQQLGVLDNVWAAVLAVGAMVAVGFVAVWSVLSNVLCTLLILIYSPFRIGDFVTIPAEGVSGEAVDLNLIFTTLRTEDDQLVQIPNNLFFQKVILRKRGKENVSLYEQFLKG